MVSPGWGATTRASREDLDAANAALREHNRELERLSMTDGLTGLYNRRYVMNALDKEILRAGRHERQLAVLMMDVDRFKTYSDTHGHLAGDRVLTGMGTVIEDATRDDDVPARYGGEEFIVILPDCGIEGALDAAERIRSRLREEVFEGGAVTCCIGVAEYPTHGVAPSELIAAADRALYLAKDSGRDRVVAAPAEGAERVKENPVARRRTPKKKAPSKKG
jgi:diguanylate cyclase (GGDEF)-like protein